MAFINQVRRQRNWPTTMWVLLAAVLASMGAVVVPSAHPAVASTSQFRGLNWADSRDNFVNGVVYVSGLGSADTYTSASTVADRVIGQMYAITGANTVRMPINEPTVASYWGTYTGAIDNALSKGKVILAYWAHSGGRPSNMTAFHQMWDTVVARYGSNTNAYFEVINEPWGYSATDLNNMYYTWLNRYSNIPRGRIILDGTGFATNVVVVGNDTRLNGTLLGVHDYTMNVTPPFEDETSWANHIAGYVGQHASRTVATEWGGPMRRGVKDGIEYDPIDYSGPSGSFFADYLRGVSSYLRSAEMGSVFWPGLRDNDWYSMTSKSGSGSNINLSLVNPSGLTRLRYAWGVGDGGGTYVRVRNASTSLYIDGMGNTNNGANATGWGDSSSTNQQWVIENSGTYVRIRNRTTGLYLDGMGRTANGAAVGQYASSTSANQQWTVLTAANNVRIKNRATGMYIDGVGNSTNGAVLAQYGDTGSLNQQWKITAVG
ncbi:RICIN domain-containing protein [Micromonospora wenchangensis]|uniref:RICIN domain-containing protein n=1 Tax=Micromonospora wenchangensis TaxID=1185415 RepID=UPI003D7217FD